MTLYRLRRRRDNAMPPKIFRHIGETSFARIVRLAFVDSDDEHIFGLVQKRKRIAHGAAALARVLPCHHDPAELGKRRRQVRPAVAGRRAARSRRDRRAHARSRRHAVFRR
jgi:hypothetical protein